MRQLCPAMCKNVSGRALGRESTRCSRTLGRTPGKERGCYSLVQLCPAMSSCVKVSAKIPQGEHQLLQDVRKNARKGRVRQLWSTMSRYLRKFLREHKELWHARKNATKGRGAPGPAMSSHVLLCQGICENSSGKALGRALGRTPGRAPERATGREGRGK